MTENRGEYNAARFGELQALVQGHCDFWVSRGQWKWPNLQDALMFLVTEVGETLDAYLRTETAGYIRNQERKRDLTEELADVVFMTLVAACLLGTDLEGKLCAKLERKSAGME